MEHNLKIWPQYFKEVIKGNKKFEIRINDRNFQKGDYIVLREFDPERQEYTGSKIKCLVTYIFYGGSFDIPEHICIISFNMIEHNQRKIHSKRLF